MEHPLTDSDTRESAPGLFEVLTGRLLDGTPLRGNGRDAAVAAVAGSVRALLRTRRGALGHLPDLGLPDLGELFRRMPGSASVLREELESALGRWEPRLARPRVEFLGFDPARALARFSVTAVLAGHGRIRLESSISSDGSGDVLRECAR